MRSQSRWIKTEEGETIEQPEEREKFDLVRSDSKKGKFEANESSEKVDVMWWRLAGPRTDLEREAMIRNVAEEQGNWGHRAESGQTGDGSRKLSILLNTATVFLYSVCIPRQTEEKEVLRKGRTRGSKAKEKQTKTINLRNTSREKINKEKNNLKKGFWVSSYDLWLPRFDAISSYHLPASKSYQ